MQLFVGNLSYDASEKDLMDLFRAFGGHDPRLVRSLTTGETLYAFVEVFDYAVHDAVRALHKTEHLGRTITVEPARLR